MKAKLIRDLEPSPGVTPQEWITEKGGKSVVAEGTVIEHPDCYKLVRNGCALPEDDECTVRAQMTPEALVRARAAYDKLISPPVAEVEDES